MSRLRFIFAFFATLASGALVLLVTQKAAGHDPGIADPVVDLIRAATFILWCLAGFSFGTKEIKDFLQRKLAEFREEDKEKDINDMFNQLGMRTPTLGSVAYLSEKTDKTTVFPFRKRHANETQ